MKIILNNRRETINKNEISVSELLEIKKFSFRMLIVKINGKIIKKNFYKTTQITNNDNVVVLHMISGG